MSAAPQTTPQTGTPQRGGDVLHTWLVIRPERTLCGLPRDVAEPGAPYGSTPDSRDDCAVCEDLARAMVDGRWWP